jgi:pyruvate,water dikinase
VWKVPFKIKATSHSSQCVTNLYWLDQIRPHQLALVGFKAFYLSQLGQNGCPVVPGFVVSAQVLQAFWTQISWSIPLFADLPGSVLRLNIDNPRQLQAIAQELQQGIMSTSLPPDLVAELLAAIAPWSAEAVILRPSLLIESHQPPSPFGLVEGVSQSAGLLTSQVVATEAEAITNGLKQVWAELFNAKSLFYWQRLGIPLHRVKLGVLVQPIQSAIAAGTLRLVDNHLEIESTLGLGMTLTRGEVIPDRYQVDRVTGQLRSLQLGQHNITYTITDGMLHSSWLMEQQRQQSSLDEAVLPGLAALMQDASHTLSLAIALEWVLPAAPAPQPLITQVLPQVVKSSVAHAAPDLKTPLAKSAELFPGAILVASGLAASGGQAIAQACVIPDITLLPDEITPHTIWIAPTIPLNWIPQISQAAALISEQGSLTSHSAIVAREMGIPAVMGVANITRQVRSGELLWIDGDRGRVYRFESSAPQPTLSPRPINELAEATLSFAQTPLQTKLMLNLSQPEQLAAMAALPVAGVGLLRAELLAFSVFQGQHPQLWLQQHSASAFVERLATAIAQFAAAFYPRPVFYRSLDLRTHELADWGHLSAGAEPDAALGLRGAFSYLLDDKLFSLELQALQTVQQMGYSNVRLLLPFVRTVAEFEFCAQRVQQMGLLAVKEFALWIMAEVPAIAWVLPELVQAGVQGISIGTNDLTQLLLGVNRDTALLSNAFNEQNLAVQRAIRQLIEGARSLNIPCSICGEAPVRYPDLISDWVHWGIDTISVAPPTVEATYRTILTVETQLQQAARPRSTTTQPDMK